MASNSSKTKKGSEMLVCGTKWKATNFKLTPTITENVDSTKAQSWIPTKVLLINDIQFHFHCTFQELGTLEMDETLKVLSVDRALKLEHKHLEDKGLIHISWMPRRFSVKWIRFIISRVHERKLWLDQPILITKKMIHQIIGLPMLAKEKSMKTLG